MPLQGEHISQSQDIPGCVHSSLSASHAIVTQCSVPTCVETISRETVDVSDESQAGVARAKKWETGLGTPQADAVGGSMFLP